jgi:ADP-heptose:LPS heptosyltransferase
MLSGAARVAQQTDPRKCRPTFQGRLRWNAIWDNNPRIARLEEVGDFQPLIARNEQNLRPYHTEKTPERWGYNLAFRPDVGELYFSEAERAFAAPHAGRIIIEPHIGEGASPNKQWGLYKWVSLVRMMRAAGIIPAHMGPEGTPRVEGADLIVTPRFRQAAAVLAGARAVVLPEGGLHHAAAAVGVPGVVIFGGFTPVELTGYAMHRNLGVSLGEACGWRTPCRHCAEVMAAISPEQVFNELEGVLRDRQRVDRGAAEIAA